MRIGMVNSRDYQFAYENVYLSALSLTLARFQFMIQGFSNWGVFYSPLTGRRGSLDQPDDDRRHDPFVRDGRRSRDAATRRGQRLAEPQQPASVGRRQRLHAEPDVGRPAAGQPGQQPRVRILEQGRAGHEPQPDDELCPAAVAGGLGADRHPELSLQERSVLYTLRVIRRVSPPVLRRPGDRLRLATRRSARRPAIWRCSTSSSHSQPREQPQVDPAEPHHLEAEFPPARRAPRGRPAGRQPVPDARLRCSQPGRASDDARRIQDQSRPADRGRGADRRLGPRPVRAQRRAARRHAHPHRGAVAYSCSRATSFRAPSWPTSAQKARRRCTASSRPSTTRWSVELRNGGARARRQENRLLGPRGLHTKEIFDRERTLSRKLKQTLDRDQRRHR